jgi:hypothetical protein
MFKRCKVVILPTNDKAEGYLVLETSYNKLFKYQPRYIFTEDYLKSIPATKNHLYITLTEEIKEGDWFIANQLPHKLINIVNDNYPYEVINSITGHRKYHSKHWGNNTIISSTNSNLNLPQPSQSFIEKYISEYNKGNIITDVMVEYTIDYKNECDCYKADITDGCSNPLHCLIIELLKVNSKDNTITIKKVKDSWNRDEVKQLFTSFLTDHPLHRGIQILNTDIDNWINNNL